MVRFCFVIKIIDGGESRAQQVRHPATQNVPHQPYLLPEAARNNMVSTVDLVWEHSLNPSSLTHPQLLRQNDKEVANRDYTRAVEGQLEREARINRSTFRVMPVHEDSPPPMRGKMGDSLTQELSNFREKRGQTISLM